MKFVDDLLQNNAAGESSDSRRSDRASEPGAAEPFTLSAEDLAKVEPALEAFYGYLDEFCGLLEQKAPTVAVDYEVMGITTLKNLIQSDYKLITQSTVVPRFTLSVLCMSKAGSSLSVATERELSEIREYLDAHRLRHRVERQSEMRFVVRLEGFVPVAFAFEPHPVQAHLRIRARNLDRLGTSSYSIDPAKVNRELMDEFGKRVLRMDNNFDRLTGFEVSDDIRAKSQQRVAARQAQREAIAGAGAEHSDRKSPAATVPLRPTDKSPSTKSPSTVSKFGSLFRRKSSSGERPGPARQAQPAPAAATSKPQRATSPEPVAKPSDAISTQRAAPAAQTAPTGPASAPSPVSKPATAQAPSPPAPADKFAEPEGEPPPYAWVVTKYAPSLDTNVSVGKLGPDGAARKYRINEVLIKGRAFQMRGEDGDLRYSGYLVGEATGFEPLIDYGKKHECTSIEYERDGYWVRLKR